MTVERLRRAVPRLPADWLASYRFDSVTEERWRCCRVVDISPAGTGVELFDLMPNEAVEGRLTISLELHGNVRYALLDEEHHSARVGAQFPSLSDAAEEYIRSFGGNHW